MSRCDELYEKPNEKILAVDSMSDGIEWKAALHRRRLN
jgi:hypothetical protein